MEVSIEVDDVKVRQLLTNTPERINRALRAAMQDANTYLLRQVRSYPPPPPPIQGPAVVPVRSFTTRSGQNVRMRANKASGKGITMEKASTLRYKRTGTLKRSWVKVLEGSGATITGGVRSSGAMAPYNVYVQGPLDGDPHQAWMHRGRWGSIDEIRGRTATQINDMFQNRIRAAVGR